MTQEVQTPGEILLAQNETTDDTNDGASPYEKKGASPYENKKVEVLGLAASRLDKLQFDRLQNALNNLEHALTPRQRQEFEKTLPDSFGRLLPDLKKDLKELTSLYEDTMKEKTPVGRKELQQRRERLEKLKAKDKQSSEQGITTMHEKIKKLLKAL